MKHFLIATGLALALTGAAHAQTSSDAAKPASGVKLSQAECDSLWMQANPTNAAQISEDQASAYITDVKSVNPDGDGTIEKNEFQNACKQGLMKSSASSGAGTGESGADR